MVFGSFWITWIVSEREGPLLASSGTALERLPLCGKHYDIMQVHLIDLMEHADMVHKPSRVMRSSLVFWGRSAEPHLKEMKWYVNVAPLRTLSFDSMFNIIGCLIRIGQTSLIGWFIYCFLFPSVPPTVFFFSVCSIVPSVPPELCWKSKLDRAGGGKGRRGRARVECQRCVSFVFIVLTAAQWHDCVAMWNSTPTQSFRGVRGGGDVCAFSPDRPQALKDPENPGVIQPNRRTHQDHPASLLLLLLLLIRDLSHYFKVPLVGEWFGCRKKKTPPSCDGQDHKAEQ